MASHCAQCGKALSPLALHRCERCGLPHCRAHAKHHDCEPKSRAEVLTWATTLERAPDEEKGALPTGSTYARVTSARLFRIDLLERGGLWLFGSIALVLSIADVLPLASDLRISMIAVGALVAATGSLLLARTFRMMHSLSPVTTLFIFLVFAAIPASIALLLA